MYYDTTYKNCYNCSGTGRVETYQYNTRYNSGRRIYQRVRQRVTNSCYQCSGRGRVVDSYRTYLNKRQRQNQQRKIQQKKKQKQRIAEQKRKQQQEAKNKQKRFKQFVNKYQNQLNKPLLQDVLQQYSSEESQQKEWPNQWLIQKVQIMEFQKQQGIIYCGVCAGTGYQRKYLSQQVNICSNCKGSGKITLNQQNQPLLVLLKPQLKINNEPEVTKNESNHNLIFCGTCAGKGYEKVYMSDEIQKCQNCNGIGKLALNPNDFPQKLKYQSYQNQAKKLQQNYKKAKQKQLKKNKKIKNRNKNIPPPKKIKSEDQLRKQFQKIQENQRVEKERKKWRQENEYQQRMNLLRKDLEQKQRKEKEQKDRRWQQFIKTPEGIKQLKKQQRQKKINDCIRKICCGRPNCKRVYQWCTISTAIVILVYTFTVLY